MFEKKAWTSLSIWIKVGLLVTLIGTILASAAAWGPYKSYLESKPQSTIHNETSAENEKELTAEEANYTIVDL